MMPKAFIIIQGEGEYSERDERPVRVYLDKAQAQEAMAKLDAIFARYHGEKWWAQSWDERTARREASKPALAAEYAALGYEASFEHDWELAEAELHN